jgi:hypothetical protein
MTTLDRKRTCFVVMPFGEKKDLDGQDIDFDDIYRFLFKKAIEDLGIECVRCDEIEEAGSIHDKMFEHIYQADVVVVDITTSNANVYYELGVRHVMAKGVTVLIRRKGTTIPFNILLKLRFLNLAPKGQRHASPGHRPGNRIAC